MIATYTGLLVELNRLIYGDEVSASDVPTATLQRIVNLGERRIYREVRARQMEQTWTGTVTGNLYPLPADFEAASVIHFGKRPLDPIAENAGIDKLHLSPGSGDAREFWEAGNSLQFWPAVSTGTAVQGRYFARLPDLSASTLPDNALFAAADDLFLYAALSKSAPFFGQDNRIPVWESEYQRIRDEINTSSQRVAYSAGRMRVRPSASVLR